MLACAIRAAQRCAGGSTAAGLASRTQQRWLSVAAVAENAGHPAGVVPGSPVDGAGRKRRKTLYTKLCLVRTNPRRRSSLRPKSTASGTRRDAPPARAPRSRRR
jgi:hypothetical protein